MQLRSRPAVFRASRSNLTRATHVRAAAAVASARPPVSTRKMRLKHMFEDTHLAMLELDTRVLDVPFLTSHTYYFRHPDDIQSILSRDGTVFVKTARIAQSKEWLGDGIFSQLDYKKHAAMRQTLNPAFRMDYLRKLDSIFVSSACQLASVLAAAAAAGAGSSAAAAAAGAGAGASDCGSSAAVGLEMQRLFRLMTLDSIGLTSMRHDFKALSTWQQQQQQQQAGSSSNSSRSSSSSGTGDQPVVDVEQMLSDLNAAFIWQSLRLPVPRSWLPGWRQYIAACNQLDTIIYGLLEERKASHAAANSSSSSSSSSSKEDIVEYLLTAQRHQGSNVITDKMIGDEIKTLMFGGSDTSSFTMAILTHHLAANPAAAERAAAEVLQLLHDRGGEVAQLTASDCGKLPFVTGCVNEALRLAPAGPIITRMATEDVEVAGYHISKGQAVVSNVYAMQRHPDIWEQPDSFIPQRWLPEGVQYAAKAKNAFQPFSLGSRSCIGRNYAMLQMVLSMAVLLGSGIRFEQVAGKEQLCLAKSLTLHSETGIWLRAVAVQ